MKRESSRLCRPGATVFRASQAAAEAVELEHPDGIDFLVVNAAIADAEHKSGIETYALPCRPLTPM